jgi:hypothetical protein
MTEENSNHSIKEDGSPESDFLKILMEKILRMLMDEYSMTVEAAEVLTIDFIGAFQASLEVQYEL